MRDLGVSRYFALRRRYAIRMISRAASWDSGSVRILGFRMRLRRMVADKWRAITVRAWKAVRSTVSFSLENDGENNIVHSYYIVKLHYTYPHVRTIGGKITYCSYPRQISSECLYFGTSQLFKH